MEATQAKCSSLEKNKQRLQGEVEELCMDLEKVRRTNINQNKKCVVSGSEFRQTWSQHVSCLRPAAAVRLLIKNNGSWRSSSETGNRSVRSWWLRWRAVRRRAGSTSESSSNSRLFTRRAWSSWRFCAGRTRPTRVNVDSPSLLAC